jgi:hypothetical protein
MGVILNTNSIILGLGDLIRVRNSYKLRVKTTHTLHHLASLASALHFLKALAARPPARAHATRQAGGMQYPASLLLRRAVP